MASSNELIDVASDVLAVNRSTCATIFRELRSAGLISNEGRGRHSAAMTARDAATFLLAICASERVQDAADAVKRYSSLMPIGGSRNLIESLISILESVSSNYRMPAKNISLSVIRPNPQAVIKLENDTISYVSNTKRSASIDTTKLRQRNIFTSDEGDLSISVTISSRTFLRLGKLL